MVKVFISQPMRGKTDEEIRGERERIETYIQDRCDAEIIDSVLDVTGKDPLFCLGESLQLLSTADMAYFAKGWQDARGCQVEHYCCEAYGIEIMEEENE